MMQAVRGMDEAWEVKSAPGQEEGNTQASLDGEAAAYVLLRADRGDRLWPGPERGEAPACRASDRLVEQLYKGCHAHARRGHVEAACDSMPTLRHVGMAPKP